MSFGKAIRRLRKENKLSQAELGERIQIPQTTISDWENDKYLPDVNLAVRLAQALNVSFIELIDEMV